MIHLYPYLRHLLFTLNPESAHHLTLQSLRCLHQLKLTSLLTAKTHALPVKAMGLTFPNALGVAAGLDKEGNSVDALGALGFGFVEVGTVTPRPQPGNPQPRLFRIPKAGAIINRMGFNNPGIETLIHHVKKRNYSGILGINIGKNFDTPNEKASEDYCLCFEKAYPYADYIAVNLSSPNTKGLRELQEVTSCSALLTELKELQARLEVSHHKKVPLAVKIAPDLEDTHIEALAQLFLDLEIEAVIATNTTMDKASLANLPHGQEQGGLSGKPLSERSTQVIRLLHRTLRNRIPIIGVGGIDSAEEAQKKIEAGAQLLQLYTGLIYQGPSLIKHILEKSTFSQKE